MQESRINGVARPDPLRAFDKARIAKTWQQYYEDRGYELWGFSPSPAARLLAQAILDSNPKRSERIEIIPHSSKKAVFGHKGYVVPISRRIFVARHLLLFPRNPFH